MNPSTPLDPHHVSKLLSRLEQFLPPSRGETDWSASAYRWRTWAGLGASLGWLQAVYQPHRISLDDLQNVDAQKAELLRNTEQFVAGRTANNVLLTGARGTGKSSLVKAVWNQCAASGLRLVELDRDHLAQLPEVIERLAERPERYIVFCDDLSFEAGDPGYKALKSALDGSISQPPANVLVYATSNRRHLLPEYFSENESVRHVDGEGHPADATEEKISLSERFGLWLSFYPFSQDDYLRAVKYWLTYLSGPQWNDMIERDALNWALARGSRSGRVAWQFARDASGRATDVSGK
ncbi:ATP-binding protein [Burkholderiaceae bacterium DAT-1]|nr:ATP-binding protein [Burkholderiaceae bacterium DAT-1]